MHTVYGFQRTRFASWCCATAFALTFLLLVPSPADAQSAALAGRVVDSTGTPVPGATVTARHLGTQAVSMTQTGSDGLYVMPALSAAAYRVEASLAGFRTAVHPNVTLSVDTRVTVNFTLAAGDVNETVTVTGAPLVDTTTSGVSTLIDRQFVENLPINGRSFQTLLELTPGIVFTEATINNPGQFSVNGQRTNANYFLVDGVSANASTSMAATSSQQAAGTLPNLTVFGGTNSLVSVDALEEFRVHASTYAAEFGRSPGAQVSLVTRSGTNRFTARAFEYYRNDAMDAGDWFRNAQGLDKLPLRQHQFGGVAGGPVEIPGLYSGRNRTFFFYSYEGSRLTQPQPVTQYALVPNAEARQLAQGALRDLFNAYPLPNMASAPNDPPFTGRYQISASFPSRFDAHSLRVDEQFGGTARLFSRVNVAPSSFEQRVFANGMNAFELDNRTWTTGLTWTPASRFVSETRVNYSDSTGRFVFGMYDVDGAVRPPDGVIFPPGLSADTASVNLQLTPFGGATQTAGNLSFGKSLGNQQRQWNIVQTFDWVRGSHDFKFGLDYRHLSPITDFRQVGISYNFGGGVAQALASGGQATVTVQALAPTATFGLHNLSLFAQDTWRTSPRLTLTYGLRYELNPPPSGDRLPYVLRGMDNPSTASLAPEGTSPWNTTTVNFGPRIGASYLADDEGKTVLRGGFGVFYDVGTGTALRGYSGFPFNSSRVTPNQTFPAPPEALEPAPFNSGAPYSAQFYTFDPDLRLPYTLQWNVGMERAIGDSQSVTVSYVGAAGRRLLRNDGYGNRAIGGQQITLLDPALFTNAATVFYTYNGSESNYRSLQIQYQRRLSRGLQALASYTWALSEDNASDEASANLIPGGVNQFVVDPDQDFGPSDFDIRHNFLASTIYDIPAPWANAVARAVLGGWGIDGIFRARSGSPFSVITLAADPLNLTTPRRVDVVPGVSPWLGDANAPAGKRLNPDAFAVPAQGRQGTLRRNSLRGFSVWQVDLSLRRRFRLANGISVEFRGDVFNVLNHPNFGEPDGTFNASTFGHATNMLNRALGAGGTAGGLNPLYQIGGPRSVQISARLLLW
jgi:hypothetical protein